MTADMIAGLVHGNLVVPVQASGDHIAGDPGADDGNPHGATCGGRSTKALVRAT